MSIQQRPDDFGLWFINTQVLLRRASAEAADGVSISEHRMPYGDSPPTHVHHREDEIFHVLEGVIRFRVGETEVVARPGDSLVGPKGVPHTFRVESESGARMVVMTPGGDFEGLIRDFARPAAADALPEAITPSPEMVERLARTCLAHNIELVGPPMGPA